MMRGFPRRGQPLAALVLILGGWVSARAMMWDPAGLPSVTPPVQSAIAVLAIPTNRQQLSLAMPDAHNPGATQAPAVAEPQGTGAAPTAIPAEQTDRVNAVPTGFAIQPDPWRLPDQATAPTPLV